MDDKIVDIVGAILRLVVERQELDEPLSETEYNASRSTKVNILWDFRLNIPLRCLTAKIWNLPGRHIGKH